MLLRGIMAGGVWNGFPLSKGKGEAVPCRFWGGPDGVTRFGKMLNFAK